MVSFVISDEAVDFILNHKKARPNIIVYRDVSGVILGYTTKPLTFIPKVKVMYGKEPDELFTIVDNIRGVPIWVERGLLPKINASNFAIITLGRRWLKELKLEMSSQLIGKP